MPTTSQSTASGNPGKKSTVLLLQSSSIVVSEAEPFRPSQSSVNMVPETESPSSFNAGVGLTPMAANPFSSPAGLWMIPSTMAPTVTMPTPPPPSISIFNTNAMSTPGQSTGVFQMAPPVTMATSSLLPLSGTGSVPPLNVSSATIKPQGSNVDTVNTEEIDELSNYLERWSTDSIVEWVLNTNGNVSGKYHIF